MPSSSSSQVSGWCQCRQTTGSWGGEAAFAAVTRPPRGRRVALPAPPLIPFFTPFFNPNFHLFFRQKSYTSSAGTMITTAGIPSDSIFYSFLTQFFTYFSDKSLTHPPRGQQVPLLANPDSPPTFSKSALFQVPENGTLSSRIQKRRPLFHANISPKWWNTNLFCKF